MPDGYVKVEGKPSKRRKVAGKPKKRTRVKKEKGKTKVKKEKVKKEGKEDKKNYQLFTSIVRSKPEITDLDLRNAFEEHRVDSVTASTFITKLERLWMRIAFIPHRYPRTFRIRPHDVAGKLKKLSLEQREVFCAIEAAADPETGVHARAIKWHLGLKDKTVKEIMQMLMVNTLIIKAPTRRVGSRAAYSASYQIAHKTAHTAFFTKDGLLDVDLFDRLYDKALGLIREDHPYSMDYKDFAKFLLKSHEKLPALNLDLVSEVFLERKIDGCTLYAFMHDATFWSKIKVKNARAAVVKALNSKAQDEQGSNIEDLHELLAVQGRDRSKKDLPLDDTKKVAQILEYDGEAEVSEEGKVKVRRWFPTQTVMNAFVNTPCGTCPVSMQCSEHGKVNPYECEFLNEWLSH